MGGALRAPVLPGVDIRLGGVEYVMPSLNAAAAKRYWPRIVALQSGQELDPLGLMCALVHACLLRNYPELPEAAVSEHVDLDNFERLSAAVMGQAAFRKWCKAQHEADAGNAPTHPQTMAAGGTGAPSTPA